MIAPAPATTTWRCFVALRPDAAAAAALDALAADLHRQAAGSRRIAREDLHLTLAFIGALAPADAHRVAARLADLDSAAFAWTLDRIGRFASARVAWAGGPDDARLSARADATRRLLDAERISYDRRPFVPHVTLLRSVRADAPRLPGAITLPIAWQAGTPRLLRSSGGHYVDVAATPTAPHPAAQDLAGINRAPDRH